MAIIFPGQFKPLGFQSISVSDSEVQFISTNAGGSTLLVSYYG